MRHTRHLMGLLLALACQPLWAADDFASFDARFRAAVIAQDRAAVASLTQLPFLFEGRALDRAAFERALPLLFAAAQRRCLAKAPAQAEGERQVVFCAPYAYYFGRAGGHYRFLEFAADGEDAP
jgi:hypothetical protein